MLKEVYIISSKPALQYVLGSIAANPRWNLIEKNIGKVVICSGRAVGKIPVN